MSRNSLVFLSLALLIPAFVLFFVGCGGDDDNPTDPGGGGNGDNDTLTTQQVVTEVQDNFSSLQNLQTECDALLLIDPTMNMDEFFFMLGMVGSIFGLGEEEKWAVADTTLADFYGTWEDTTVAGDLMGVVRTAATPATAFKILLESVDSTGTPITGNLTISSLTRTVNIQQSTMTISASLSLNEDGGESASIDFSVTIDASLLDGGINLDSLDTIPEIDMTLSGDFCGLEVEMNLTTSENGTVSLTGYYEFDGERMSYSMETDATEEPICAEFEVWEGTSQSSTEFYLAVTVCDSIDDCVSGSIEIEGVEEVTFWAEDCDADSPSVYMDINGETFTGEEVFEEFAALFDMIWGIDLEDLGELNKVGSEPAYNRSGRFLPLKNNPALFLTKGIIYSRN